MSTKHTAGPWIVDGETNIFAGPNKLAIGYVYRAVVDATLPFPANAKRIVECVNACEGAESPAELIEGGWEAARKYAVHRGQVAELKEQINKIESLVSMFTERWKQDIRSEQSYSDFWRQFNAITGINAGAQKGGQDEPA